MNSRRSVNRGILSLSIPNIITNVTVPLLGMVDMAIVGHLSAQHIGAITIGTSLFNIIYWNFGFLRSGTSGFAAQAFGSGNEENQVKTLVRSVTIAFIISASLLILQWPIGQLAKVLFKSSEEVISLALRYFYIRIWAAPATLSLFSIKGWLIGMQNSKTPMWIALFINVVNILFSLLFVIVLKWDISGVALGTVIAQYSGLLLALFLGARGYGRMISKWFSVKKSLVWKEMKGFFKVNGDIFLRTLCISAVFTFVTAASAQISDDILAIDALLLQFCTLFSYIMDGFAFAAESLVGRYVGAKDKATLKLSVKLLMAWSLAMTVCFTIVYALWSEPILRIFSNDNFIIQGAMEYSLWIVLIPVCGFGAFLFDGVYIGATASKAMRNSMIVASGLFFVLYFAGKGLFAQWGMLNSFVWNNILWTAFLIFLVVRGLMLFLLLNRSIYSRAE